MSKIVRNSYDCCVSLQRFEVASETSEERRRTQRSQAERLPLVRVGGRV
jgi:hypothetical protein